jgi:hypothetical protein
MMNASTIPAGRLAAFQEGFAAALLVSETSAANPVAGRAEIARLAAQPGFAVYRNTVLKGCVDALQANYPAVSRLVGDAWFRAAAAVHARAELPRQPMLLDYGSGFATFLAEFEPAVALPYLACVARLDRYWTEAHIARDEPPTAAADVARLDATSLARTVLRPHASARWAWFDEQPIVSIWQRNRQAASGAADEDAAMPGLAWHGEGVLIVRPHAVVEWIPLDKSDCAFLDACAAGGTLADAAAAALAANAHADLAALMARTLAAGAFGSLAISPDNLPECS